MFEGLQKGPVQYQLGLGINFFAEEKKCLQFQRM